MSRAGFKLLTRKTLDEVQLLEVPQNPGCATRPGFLRLQA